MKFILGKKRKMTQVFDETGRVFPATVVSAGPVTVTQIKDGEKDGYEAIQVAFGTQKEKNLKKAQKGHFGELGAFKTIRELRAAIGETKKGDVIDVTTFEVGDKVEVSATTKGKGNQGVVKRHNFAGGPRTHGNKHSERRPGSIGSTGPQRVLKGLKMAGRMGGNRVTVKNLQVLQVDKDTNTLVISGAIPGRPGTLVEVRGK
jgi:large subunit ribosomal protein L3